MAYYDLHCSACGGDFFDIQASVEDKANRRIFCPDCGSNQLEKIYNPVSIHVKSNSSENACPRSSICGASCPGARFS